TEVEEALAFPPICEVSALRRAADRGVVVGQRFVRAAEARMDVGAQEQDLGAELCIALQGVQCFRILTDRVMPSRELEGWFSGPRRLRLLETFDGLRATPHGREGATGREPSAGIRRVSRPGLVGRHQSVRGPTEPQQERGGADEGL